MRPSCVCGGIMNFQSKNVSSSSVTGAGATGATKNTRRRIHQKRTRNTNRPKSTEDKVKPPVVLSKPVLESTNPFFIAVCAPDSYKPSSSSSSSFGGGGINPIHRSNSLIGGDIGNRRDTVSQRQKPNVFLRQNSRNTQIVSSNGPGMINHFIHHPMIQNDRHRGDIMTGVLGTEIVQTSRTGLGSSCKNNNMPADIHDKEQFPSLSSSVLSPYEPVIKLNFKEMVMKNSSTSTTDTGTVTSVSVISQIPKVRSEYAQQAAQQASQKALSSGNIFLGAFYGSRDEVSGLDDGEHDDEYVQKCEKTVISSALIDSCDRKYDNLYR